MLWPKKFLPQWPASAMPSGMVLCNQVAYGRPLTLMKSTAGVQRLFKTTSVEKFEGVVHEGAIMRNRLMTCDQVS